MLRRVGEPESGVPEPPTLRGRARTIALVWVVAVSALYVAVRVFGLQLLR